MKKKLSIACSSLVVMSLLVVLLAGCASSRPSRSQTTARQKTPIALVQVTGLPPAVRSLVQATNGAAYIVITTRSNNILGQIIVAPRLREEVFYQDGGIVLLQKGTAIWQAPGLESPHSSKGYLSCYQKTRVTASAISAVTMFFPETQQTHYHVSKSHNFTIVHWHSKPTNSSGIFTANAQNRIVAAVVQGINGKQRYTLTYPSTIVLPVPPLASGVCPV